MTPGWAVLRAIAAGERELGRHRRPKLLRAERTRILAGDYSPLIRLLEPAFTPGQRVVVSWTRPTKTSDEKGNVSAPPPAPLLVLEITAKIRKRTGEWAVRFNVEDFRETKRLLRSKPPVHDYELMKRDAEKPPTAEEIARAREESAYTSNPGSSIDHLDAVGDDELKRDRLKREVAMVNSQRFGRQTKVAEKLRLERKLANAVRRGAEIQTRVIRVRLMKVEDEIRAVDRRLDRAA